MRHSSQRRALWRRAETEYPAARASFARPSQRSTHRHRERPRHLFITRTMRALPPHYTATRPSPRPYISLTPPRMHYQQSSIKHISRSAVNQAPNATSRIPEPPPSHRIAVMYLTDTSNFLNLAAFGAPRIRSSAL
jgi:hypothetical protein